MPISVWSAFTFAIRNTIRPVTLGFVGLQIGQSLLIMAAALVLLPAAADFSVGMATSGPGWRFYLLSCAVFVVLLPAYFILYARLCAQVFGRTPPVPWRQGTWRLLKAFLVVVVAHATYFIIVALPLAFLRRHFPAGPAVDFIIFVGPAVILACLDFIYLFYPFGVLFKGSFDLWRAREYSRGRRLRLFVELLPIWLASGLIQWLLSPDVLGNGPMDWNVVSSAFDGALMVPLIILVTGHFFDAMDEADARTADNPAPEFAPTAFEG